MALSCANSARTEARVAPMHEKCEAALNQGTPVRAIGEGVVIRAGVYRGYGNCLEIRHRNGYVSRYGHLSRFASSVRVGQHVDVGQTVAFVGSTGLATGPHLHFETRLKGVPTDPEAIVDFSRPETTYAEELRLALEAFAAAEERARAGG